jgi:hypothetical protein
MFNSFLVRSALVMVMACSGLSAMAERIVFDMSAYGLKLGQMVITRTVVNDTIERYTVRSEGKSDFLWLKREEQRTFEVEYRHGKLYSSDFEYIENGKQIKWSTIRFDGEKYVMRSQDGIKEFDEPLDFSLVKLYFDPTLKQERVFCEEDCTYATVERNNQTLAMVSEDGNKSTYHIKDGRVEAIDVHFLMATVKLTRVN